MNVRAKTYKINMGEVPLFVQKETPDIGWHKTIIDEYKKIKINKKTIYDKQTGYQIELEEKNDNGEIEVTLRITREK